MKEIKLNKKEYNISSLATDKNSKKTKVIRKNNIKITTEGPHKEVFEDLMISKLHLLLSKINIEEDDLYIIVNIKNERNERKQILTYALHKIKENDYELVGIEYFPQSGIILEELIVKREKDYFTLNYLKIEYEESSLQMDFFYTGEIIIDNKTEEYSMKLVKELSMDKKYINNYEYIRCYSKEYKIKYIMYNLFSIISILGIVFYLVAIFDNSILVEKEILKDLNPISKEINKKKEIKTSLEFQINKLDKIIKTKEKKINNIKKKREFKYKKTLQVKRSISKEYNNKLKKYKNIKTKEKIEEQNKILLELELLNKEMKILIEKDIKEQMIKLTRKNKAEKKKEILEKENELKEKKKREENLLEKQKTLLDNIKEDKIVKKITKDIDDKIEDVKKYLKSPSVSSKIEKVKSSLNNFKEARIKELNMLNPFETKKEELKNEETKEVINNIKIDSKDNNINKEELKNMDIGNKRINNAK